jgi:hypothetical protein
MPAPRNASAAVIEPAKLTLYCLNPDNERGRDKARVFKAALGFELSNYLDLVVAIRQAILVCEALFLVRTKHGELWQVDMPVAGPTGTAIVRTGWIYEAGSDVPRLTTAYVRG